MDATNISSMELRQSIGDILNRVQYAGERFVVERKGEPVAAIVSIEALERLERLEAEREEELFRLAQKAAAEGGVLPFAALIEQYKTLHGETLETPEGV